MRDLLVALIVFGSLPVILWRPWTGVLMWSWIGYMNPHRLSWGFAWSFPFAAVIAATTIVAMVFSKEKLRLPRSGLLLLLALFLGWTTLTTLFALGPEAGDEWSRLMKVQLGVLLTLLLCASEDRLRALIWVIAGSVAFYGVKGGIFSIATGGAFLVRGPPYSFFSENNTLGLALLMTLPLLWFLFQQTANRYARWALIACMVLCAIAVFGTRSRGAAIAGVVVMVYLALKSRHKSVAAASLVVMALIGALLMPQAWFDRMGTISDYQSDASAMGRINAWWFAWNLAVDRPLLGGGFGTFLPELFEKYAPDPLDVHDAHSIYFEVLAEQGFVGLGFFLLLGIAAFRAGSRIIRLAGQVPALAWARDLAAMLQVSLVAYASAGAFLGLAYFDFYYHIVAILILLNAICVQHLARETASGVVAPATPAPSGTPYAVRSVR